MKRAIAVLMVLAMALMAGCAGSNQAVTKTAAEMVAEEIGVAVAQNNPDLAERVELYYGTIQTYYEDGDFDLLSIALEDGLTILCAKYVGDPLTAARIKSKVRRLRELSGLEQGMDIPGAEKLRGLAPEYIMDVVEAFVGGVRMVSQA